MTTRRHRSGQRRGRPRRRVCGDGSFKPPDSRPERRRGRQGKSSAVISGKITARGSVVYKLNARNGQFLKASLVTDKHSADFNIYTLAPSLTPRLRRLNSSAAATNGTSPTTLRSRMPRLPLRRFLLGCCTPRLEFVTILSPPGFMP